MPHGYRDHVPVRGYRLGIRGQLKRLLIDDLGLLRAKAQVDLDRRLDLLIALRRLVEPPERGHAALKAQIPIDRREVAFPHARQDRRHRLDEPAVLLAPLLLRILLRRRVLAPLSANVTPDRRKADTELVGDLLEGQSLPPKRPRLRTPLPSDQLCGTESRFRHWIDPIARQ